MVWVYPTSPPPEHLLGLRIDEYQVAAGEKVVVPIHWENNITAARPDSLSFQVSFSPLHYNVDTVYSGNLPGTQVEHTYANGKLNVLVRGLGLDFGLPGTIVVMEGTALPAIPDSTAFGFSNAELWSQEPVMILHDPGLLVVDVCGPRNMILLAAPTSVRTVGAQPAHDAVRFEVRAPYSEELDVELVDAIGNVVYRSLGIQVPSGTSTVSVPVNVLPAGLYVLQITTQRGGRFSHPVLVVQ